MATSRGSTDKDFDPHWHQTQQHGQDISELKAGQARLEVGVSSLGDRMAHGFQTLQVTLADRTQRTPTPWVAIGMLILGSIGSLGTVLAFGFALITNNMQRENDLRFDNLDSQLTVITQRAEDMHSQFEQRLTADDDMQLKNAYADGKRDAIDQALMTQLEHLRTYHHLD